MAARRRSNGFPACCSATASARRSASPATLMRRARRCGQASRHEERRPRLAFPPCRSSSLQRLRSTIPRRSTQAARWLRPWSRGLLRRVGAAYTLQRQLQHQWAARSQEQAAPLPPARRLLLRGSAARSRRASPALLAGSTVSGRSRCRPSRPSRAPAGTAGARRRPPPSCTTSRGGQNGGRTRPETAAAGCLTCRTDRCQR